MQMRAGVAAALQLCALLLLPSLAVGQANQSAVVSLSLINADTDQPIAGFDPLTDGATLNLALLPTRNLNLRANVTGTVGSVRFGLDASPTFRVDDSSPYSLAGDTNGNYVAWTPLVGQHTVTATPFRMTRARGPAGKAHTVRITVVDGTGPNQPPTVSAGADQTITLPTSAVTRSEAGSEGEVRRAPLTVAWTKVSGAGTVTFGTPGALTTTATFGSAGSYVLQLTATDSALSASDTVTVTVNQQPPTNQPPTVSAGADQTITLPTSAVT